MKATIPAVWLLLLALGACAQRPPLSVTDRDTLAACQAHADAVYDRLNRGAIYRIGDNGAPNSSTGLVGDPTAVLSARYARDRMIDRCVRGVAPSGAAVAPPVAAPAAQPAR